MRKTWTADDWTFLLGSAWEGTGDELHTNRLSAGSRSEEFEGRILSGITTCVRSLYEAGSDWLYTPSIELDWSFDSPVYEDDPVSVDAEESDPLHVAVAVAERQCGGGSIKAHDEPAPVNVPGKSGLRLSGRTFSEADSRLFHTWLPSSRADEAVIPWPLVLFTVSRQFSLWGGIPHSTLLNRAMNWRSKRTVSAGESLDTYLISANDRRSVSRAPFQVVEIEARVVSANHGDVVGEFSWVVLKK